MVSLDGASGAVASRRVGRIDVALFATALFVSAFLLFSIQPMFAKQVLPKLGGAPAVWSVAMVFFQSVLLAGYAYAHWLTSRLPVRRAVLVQLAVMTLAVFAMPIGIAESLGAPPSSFTALWLIALFAASVGLPFFAVSGNGPLLQAWFGRTGHPHAADPYFLYGASNVGSFVALLSYPVLFEPMFGAQEQSLYWMAGFLVLMALIAACGVRVMGLASTAPGGSVAVGADDAAASAPPSALQRLIWVGLAFVPSALLVAVTAHLSTDVAAAPFLWVLPLALFLLTFVITFQRQPWLKHSWMLALQPPLVGAVVLTTIAGMTFHMGIAILLHLVTFFVVAMACHGELVRQRPDGRHLTGFYLWMSLGGVLGGIFAGLIAPAVFNTVVEYPLVLMLSLAAHPALWTRDRTLWVRSGLVAVGVLALVGFPAAIGYPASEAPVILFYSVIALLWGFVTLQRTVPLRHALVLLAAIGVVKLHVPPAEDARAVRSFFGVHKTHVDANGEFRLLVHGTTIHGAERIRTADGQAVTGRPQPTTYYWFGSPMGEAIETARALRGGQLDRLAAIGLGTGSFACHRRDGEAWTFYEIDPLVVDIARDPTQFRFLAECAPDMPVVLGDARLTIADKANGAYELVVVDAFSSDAIPVHLLTREAIDTYFRTLDATGFAVFHISNRHMELSRTLAAVAQSAGYVTYAIRRAPNAAGLAERHAESAVVVMARDPAHLGAIASGGVWTRVEPLSGQRPWTDDFSNVMEPIWRHYVRQDMPYARQEMP